MKLFVTITGIVFLGWLVFVAVMRETHLLHVPPEIKAAHTFLLYNIGWTLLAYLVLLLIAAIVDEIVDDENRKKRAAADAFLQPMLKQLQAEEQAMTNQLTRDVRSAVDPQLDVQINLPPTDK